MAKTKKTARKKKPVTAPSAGERTSGRRGRPRAVAKIIAKHLAQRDLLWPDADQFVWDWNNSKGYVHVPRLLPLVMVLINELSPSGDPSAVYLEIWTRCLDGGFYEVDDEEGCAYAAGYTGQRAVRTWRERMRTLRKLGFIETLSTGNREFGSVLIINPLLVCARLRHDKDTKVPDAWWSAFVSRARKISADIPTVKASRASS